MKRESLAAAILVVLSSCGEVPTSNPDEFAIEVWRQGCATAACPQYQLIVMPEGHAYFEAERHMPVAGSFMGRMDPHLLRQLVEKHQLGGIHCESTDRSGEAVQIRTNQGLSLKCRLNPAKPGELEAFVNEVHAQVMQVNWQPPPESRGRVLVLFKVPEWLVKLFRR